MAGHKIVWKMHALFTTCQSVAFYWATRAVTNTRLFPEDSVSEECLWPLPHVCRWCGRCSRSLPWSQSRGTSASSLPSSWAPLHRVRTKRTSHHRHRPLLNTQRTSDLNSKLCWYCAKPKDYEWHTKQIDRSSNSTFLRAFWGRVRLEDSSFLITEREAQWLCSLLITEREARGLCSLLIPTIHKVWDVINMQEYRHHLK